MTLPDRLDDPAVLIIAAAALLALLWLALASRARSRQRDSASVIAAVQSERDVLRANHAVEIATLEGKLAEAQERARKNLDAALRLKEAETEIEDLKGRVARLDANASQQRETIASLTAERDELSGQLEGLPRLQADRDRAAADLEEQSRTIGELRAELQRVTTELGRATAGRGDENEEIASLTRERDRALADVEAQSRTIGELRSELQRVTTELGRASAPREEEDAEAAGEALSRLARERDEAREEARRLSETVGELRQEVKGLGERLHTAGGSGEREVALAAEAAELRGEVDRLAAAVAERDATIEELRQAVATETRLEDEGEIGRLNRELEAAHAREKAANENLSRLAYEADQLRHSLAGYERQSGERSVEVERRDALLELRLQKIYELEAKLRDQHTALREAHRRAEVAEESLAAMAESATFEGDAPPGAAEGVTPAIEAETAERIERLQTRLDEVREENAALLSELEALRTAAEEGVGESAGVDESAISALAAERDAALRRASALEERVAALEDDLAAARARVAQAPRSVGPEEITQLKAELRRIAARFLEQSGVPETETPAEPTLAERIRAFKAARDAARGG